MLGKDVAYVAAEYLISRSRALWASACDIAGDIMSLLTIGYGGYAIVQQGFGIDSVWVILSIAIGSLLGTLLGLRLGKVINNEMNTPTPKAPLSAEEKKLYRQRDSASGLTLFERRQCVECGGLHLTACPRVKSIGPEGSREYWPWDQFPKDNIIWADEVYDDDEEAASTQ